MINVSGHLTTAFERWIEAQVIGKDFLVEMASAPTGCVDIAGKRRSLGEAEVTIRLNCGDSTGKLMIPWIELERAPVPGEANALRLMQRGAEFSIRLGTVELMNSRRSGSENALGTLACRRLHGRVRPRILIGGLGLGFTLRAALAELGTEADVVVAEIVPAVAAWARGPLAGLFAGSLDDPRVTLVVDDVKRVIETGRARYDAILLDVDNGPEGLTRRANDGLYTVSGVQKARAALRPLGLLSIWSWRPDAPFKARLARAGFDVEERRVYAHGSSGHQEVIWLATLP